MTTKKKPEAPAAVLAPIGKIKAHPHNPRQHESEADLKELADSIAELGLLQPILCRSVGKGQAATYQVVAGHRRLRACKIAGLKQVPILLRALEDDEALMVQIVENLHREDLLPSEEAAGFARLLNDHGLKAEEIAARVGKSKAYVYGRQKLLELTTANAQLLDEGRLEPSVAIMLARVKDPETQDRIAAEELCQTDHCPAATVQAAKRAIAHHQRDLRKGGFDRKDPDLPGGACADCPFREGNTCHKPSCFEDNVKAATATKLEKAAKKGETVHKGARSLEHDYQSADLAKPIGWDFGGMERLKETWGEAIRAHSLELDVRVAADTKGQVRRYVKKADAIRALSDAGHPAAQKKAKETKQSERHEAKRKKLAANEDAVAAALIDDVRTAWDESLKGIVEKNEAVAWRLILELLYDVLDMAGVEACPPKRETLPGHKVPGAVLSMLLADTIERGNIESPAVKAVLADADTSLAAIVKDVERQKADEAEAGK